MRMLSPIVPRWKSAGICSGVTVPASTSITTRRSIAMAVSPGSGIFCVVSAGCPTTVGTRYISPTWRSSCCCVATFFESGDHCTMARALLAQPALSVA